MNKTVEIDYTNYKGIRGIRVIRPEMLFYGHTPYHQEDQWLLQALDIDKNATRTFAMKDVHSWKPLD